MVVVIIGGGAAGFFSAITCASLNKNAQVIILEKSDKVLSKVRVSGGGRCNVTNACSSIETFASHYPRGKELLLSAFKVFSNKDTIEWFKKRRVSLKAEDDGRMFPVTDSSQTIIDCLLSEASLLKINIRTKSTVRSIHKKEHLFHIGIQNADSLIADKVIVASGGYPQLQQYSWIKDLGLSIVEPVPSLFTFNIPSSPLKDLMGVSQFSEVSISKTNYSYQGPLLITHWGLSGPAILKLSAFAARQLAEKKYEFDINVRWASEGITVSENELKKIREANPKKLVRNVIPFSLPKRLWELFCDQAEIRAHENWAELGNKKLQVLFALLSKQSLHVSGKTTFKEEFVTCGGISLTDINPSTMEALYVPGLYLAGEALDIDGITGGFNFQAAWTTGYIAGKHAAL
ncbi:MAG: NAD(P)/FAD-dependent oxidoreductase [Cytophagales bacterium]|nr:NAD(P)/FAD-dependent oxidoreductase [Cytophaga sp.]